MENDKELREKFSKVLGAPSAPTNAYSTKESYQTYSWEEIFCEIGRLKERAEQKPVERVYMPSVMPPSGTLTFTCPCGKNYPHTCVIC